MIQSSYASWRDGRRVVPKRGQQNSMDPSNMFPWYLLTCASFGCVNFWDIVLKPEFQTGNFIEKIDCSSPMRIRIQHFRSIRILIQIQIQIHDRKLKSHQRRTSSTSELEIFFLLVWVIFARLDPDAADQSLCGSGSEALLLALWSWLLF